MNFEDIGVLKPTRTVDYLIHCLFTGVSTLNYNYGEKIRQTEGEKTFLLEDLSPNPDDKFIPQYSTLHGDAQKLVDRGGIIVHTRYDVEGVKSYIAKGNIGGEIQETEADTYALAVCRFYLIRELHGELNRGSGKLLHLSLQDLKQFNNYDTRIITDKKDLKHNTKNQYFSNRDLHFQNCYAYYSTRDIDGFGNVLPSLSGQYSFKQNSRGIDTFYDVEVAHTNGEINLEGDFTISAWWKGTEPGKYFNQLVGGPGGEINLIFADTSTFITIRTFEGMVMVPYYFLFGDSLDPAFFHHIRVTRDMSENGLLNVYLDGTEAPAYDTNNMHSTGQYIIQDIRLDALQGGLIHDIAVFGDIISDDLVRDTLRNLPLLFSPGKNNLLHWWRFGNNEGDEYPIIRDAANPTIGKNLFKPYQESFSYDTLNHWEILGNNTYSIEDGALHIDYVDNESGAILSLGKDYDLTEDIEIGKYIQFGFDAKITDEDHPVELYLSGKDVYDTSRPNNFVRITNADEYKRYNLYEFKRSSESNPTVFFRNMESGVKIKNLSCQVLGGKPAILTSMDPFNYIVRQNPLEEQIYSQHSTAIYNDETVLFNFGINPYKVGVIAEEEFTISFWFKAKANTYYSNLIKDMGGSKNITIYTADTSYAVWVGSSNLYSLPIPTDTWVNILINRDSASDVRVYMDGVESDSGAQNIVFDFEFGSLGTQNNYYSISGFSFFDEYKTYSDIFDGTLPINLLTTSGLINWLTFDKKEIIQKHDGIYLMADLGTNYHLEAAYNPHFDPEINIVSGPFPSTNYGIIEHNSPYWYNLIKEDDQKRSRYNEHTNIEISSNHLLTGFKTEVFDTKTKTTQFPFLDIRSHYSNKIYIPFVTGCGGEGVKGIRDNSFSWETWVRFNDLEDNDSIITVGNPESYGGGASLFIHEMNTEYYISFQLTDSVNNLTVFRDTTTPISVDDWYYVNISRVDTGVIMYIGDINGLYEAEGWGFSQGGEGFSSELTTSNPLTLGSTYSGGFRGNVGFSVLRLYDNETRNEVSARVMRNFINESNYFFKGKGFNNVWTYLDYNNCVWGIKQQVVVAAGGDPQSVPPEIPNSGGDNQFPD